MKKTQISVTAQGIAFARAYESSKPEGERICYDPLARRMVSPAFYLLCRLFAGYGEKKAPGAIGFLTVRCRYIDDVLQARIASSIQQLVILGAGLDSRPYRFKALKGSVKTFEIDSPATQSAKLARLKEIFKAVPAHVTFVPVDFNEENLEKLTEFGFDRSLKTLFIWEGVVCYLTAEAVDRTLEFVLQNSSPGSSIVFDYIYTSALTAAQKRGEVTRMQRASLVTGEGLTFGIEEGTIESFLQKRGFSVVEHMTSQDLHSRYFTGPNQRRTVAPVYAIVHAQVGLKVGCSPF